MFHGRILFLVSGEENICLGYHFDSNALNNTAKAALFYHRLIEAFKFAFAQRTELADPEQIPLGQVRSIPSYFSSRSALIAS